MFSNFLPYLTMTVVFEIFQQFPVYSLSTNSTSNDEYFPIKSEQELLLSKTFDNLLKNYDRRIRPHHGGQAVIVGISMYLISIPHVSEVNMEFQTDVYFRQNWIDSRLDYTQQPQFLLDDSSTITPPKFLRLDFDEAKNIWSPDTFFPNEKFAYIHSATKLNEFTKIHPGGSVHKSTRLTLGVSCPMKLKYFPMDSQLCSIKLESYGYTSDELILEWSARKDNSGLVGSPFGISREDIQAVDFRVVGYRLRSSNITLSGGQTYTTLACDIQLNRSMGFYLMQIYVPSALLVILSWFPLWMTTNFAYHNTNGNFKTAGERITIGITTILTMTMLLAAVNSTSPKIPYVKAIDVYLGICFTFIFFGLMESAAVGYVATQVKGQCDSSKNKSMRNCKCSSKTKNKLKFGEMWRNKSRKKFESFRSKFFYSSTMIPTECDLELRSRQRRNIQTDDGEKFEIFRNFETSQDSTWATRNDGGTTEEHLYDQEDNTHLNLPAKIDMMARIILPISFLVVNLIYWVYYLNVSQMDTQDLVYWHKTD